jgi:peptidoglycan-N-acetylglucosamine deacetylase
VLARYGAHATFFMIGSAAQRHPDLVDAIVASGHAIGCHSWDHKAFTALSHRERLAQLQACERIPVFTKHKLFRPPYGCQNLASRIDLLREGWTPVIWNITGTDWRDDPADAIVARIAEQLVPGSIVLLHDALHDVERAEYAAREPMLQAVAQLLERFRDRYRFVTVPQLMRAGRPQRALWWHEVGADYLAQLQYNTDSHYLNERSDNNDNHPTTLYRQ